MSRRTPLVVFFVLALLPCIANSQITAPSIAQTGPVAEADHVAIYVRNADASAAFYIAAFGMQDLHTHMPNGYWLKMGPSMTLHIVGGRKDPIAPPNWVHLALRTDDLMRSIAYLDAHHIAWSNIPGTPRTFQTRYDGVRQIFLQDPDGYWIEISDARGVPHPGNPGLVNETLPSASPVP